MLKNNQNSQPQSNNANYLSWFVRDSQDLKRGGTAPIMPSRKSRQTSHNDPFNASQDNDTALNNEENTKNIPVITTSYGNSHPLNQSRGGGTPTGESHRITKVAHPSGVSVYRLTKKKSLTSENNNSQLPSNAFEALNNGLTSPNQKQDRSRNTPGLPSHEDLSSKDLQDTPLSFMSPGVSSSSFNARPGSSHFKGGSAFRRTRILNESSQNNEEFQTPNTGNLDLESLNNLNNQSTGRDSSPPNQSKHDLRTAQDSRIGVNLRQPMTRQNQNDPFENELDNIAQLKNFNEARIPQRGPFKGRYGGFGNDDNHDNKAVRVVTADTKTKPKPVIEGRRYAEDVEALNLSDEEDGGGFATANSRPSAAKEQNKESLVSIIGRNMQGERETQPKKNERHDDEENIFNKNAQKFTLDFGDTNLDSNLTPHQRGGFVQRPPARKNGQAMNLDDRSMQSEKKPLMMSPGQEQHFERPPSRHKIPTKALGLDLPEEPVKSTPMGILQNHERETPVQKRETVTAAVGRRANNLRTGDSDFEFENNDFENLNFNKVLDLSDFLEGDEAPQNQSRSHARPKTTAGAQRDSFQSNQPPKNQGIGIGIGKHIGLQSAKGRPISGLGHNPLLSSKLEAFNNMRNNRSAKDSRLENAYNPSKDNHMKSKLKLKNDHDLDNCDVYNMESDSDSFEASLSNRQSFNNTNGISRNQSGSKLWGQEKGSKKEGLTLGQNMFKDKKSQIVFIHNKGTQSTKKENIDLPFETTLEKDFVGLFAN